MYVYIIKSSLMLPDIWTLSQRLIRNWWNSLELVLRGSYVPYELIKLRSLWNYWKVLDSREWTDLYLVLPKRAPDLHFRKIRFVTAVSTETRGWTWRILRWCWRRLLRIRLTAKRSNQPVNPKGNQSLILAGRTVAEADAPIIWPPDVKNWPIGKESNAGQDWRREKGMSEDKMVEWHHPLSGHEFE